MPASAPATTAAGTATAHTGHRVEEDFVNDFAARLEAGTVGVDRGRARDARVAADEQAAPKNGESKEKVGKGEKGEKGDGSRRAPAASAKSGTATETTDRTSASSDVPDDEPEIEDEELDETAETGDTPAEEESAEEAIDETDEQEDDELEPESDAEDELEPEEPAADEESPAETELANEARAALTKHGLTMTMDDLPKEARPLVKAKLDGMLTAFTRAMMEQRAYRKEEAAFRAERQFVAQNPELAILEMFDKDPALIERVQARLDETATATGKEAVKVVTKDKRAEALRAVTEAAHAIERVNQRADEIESYTRRACATLDLPFDIVIDAVVNRLHEKPDDARDLTQDEIDGVIGKQQRLLARYRTDRTRGERQANIRERKKDRTTVSPAAKQSVGRSAPAPVAAKPPKTDAEFVDYMASKMGGNRR